MSAFMLKHLNFHLKWGFMDNSVFTCCEPTFLLEHSHSAVHYYLVLEYKDKLHWQLLRNECLVNVAMERYTSMKSQDS